MGECFIYSGIIKLNNFNKSKKNVIEKFRRKKIILKIKQKFCSFIYKKITDFMKILILY
jgi:hypothetical protein